MFVIYNTHCFFYVNRVLWVSVGLLDIQELQE